MGLFSFLQRHRDGPPAAPSRKSAAAGDSAADSVQQARVRARQRLIGATVLVVVGIIVFPLIFETQPRPIAVDIPIEIPRKESAPALAMPAARPATPVAETPPQAAEMITESRAEAGRETNTSTPETRPAAPANPSAPTPPAPVKPAAQPPADPPVMAQRPAPVDSARAQALLDDKPAAAARYVVQVGAFADAAAARDMRVKVERLGLKTYMQVTDTASGARTRVRVGPVSSREEADKLQARIRAAGLPAVVLTL